MERKKVVIIGGGFGGLTAATKLKNSNFDIVIIDKTNHHLFQPLLYQVATAALSPGDIASPIRAVFKKKKNIKVLLDEVLSIDKENQIIKLHDSEMKFDYLIVAPGSSHSYFGHDEWEKFAPGLKTLNDGLKIREKILFSLEEAEKIADKNKRNKYLNFVIVGGGPTGVELAGAIAEIAKKTMMKDFRNFTASETKIYLIEGQPKILPPYPDKLSEIAKKDLEKLGVEVILNKMVLNIDEKGVKIKDRFIESKTIIWAAGNQVSPLVKSLNVELDKVGRVIVQSDLRIKENKNIFVIGDAALFKDEKGQPLPAVAQVAMQQGRFAAEIIMNSKNEKNQKPFKYNDKGNMATIGRAKAVADIKGFKLSGIIAWLVWSFIHILFLIGFRNRFRVMLEWMWLYISNRQGIRLIVGRASDQNDK